MKHAQNAGAWAIGAPVRNGFHVRRVVWGLVMARAERRPGEEIRKAKIMVGPPRRHGRIPANQAVAVCSQAITGPGGRP